MSPAHLLSEAERQVEHIVTMARVFEKADRTLSSTNVHCTAVAKTGAPAAYNDGEVITFNVATIGSVTEVDDIIKLNGLNYHELSHILYTPRMNDPFMQKVRNNGWFDAWNVLEDQRIEALFTSMYPGTRPYFVTIIMKYIADDPKTWNRVLPLTWGRQYLDAAIRDEFANLFHKPEKVADIKRIIDRYRLLAMPNDETEALRLVEEFFRLMLDTKTGDIDPYGHEGRQGVVGAVMTKGAPESGQDQSATAEWAAVEGELSQDGQQSGSNDDGDDDAAGSGGGSGDGSGTGQNGQDGTGSGQGDQDSKGNGTGQQKGAQGSQKGKGKGGKSDPNGESGGGTGSEGTAGVREGKFNPSDFAKKMAAAIDAATSSSEVKRYVKSAQNTIVRGDGVTAPFVPQKGFAENPVPQPYVDAARKVGREFQRLASDLDPGYRTHQPSGRINVQRAMHSVDLDTVFDQWDEGRNEAADIEYVMALDFSGSMSGRMHEASLAMWTVKRAVEMLGQEARVTVFGFDSMAYVFYPRGERAHSATFRSFASGGSTVADQAVYEARRIFHNSRSKNKVFTVITDGQWAGARVDGGIGWNNMKLAVDDSIEEMGAAGVTTSVVYIGSMGQTPNRQVMDSVRHKAQMLHFVKTPADIVMFSRDLVKKMMRGGR